MLVEVARVRAVVFHLLYTLVHRDRYPGGDASGYEPRPNGSRSWLKLAAGNLPRGAAGTRSPQHWSPCKTEPVKQVFTVREVYAEMLSAGTGYAASTVFKTMRRMKFPPERPPYVQLLRVGLQGFRLAD
jgi:hypothetical protein